MLKKLLSTPTTQLGKAGRFATFQIKLWSHCARLLIKNRSGQRAAALSYHTIFGIVPLTIVMLLVFQSLPAYSGLGEKVRDIVYQQLNFSAIEILPDPVDPQKTVELTEYLEEKASSFFTGVNEFSIAGFSIVIVIFAALALLSTIEKSFNSIWHVSRGRNFLQRIINYWAILTLGPLLLASGIYISTRYTNMIDIQKTITIAPAILSYIVATVAFFLLYFVLPNTRVQTKSAIWGAAVAALVWMIAKWGFAMYVTKFMPYSQIYGTLGLIPLSVFWIFISWLIVLFGLQLTFTTQHLKSLDAAEIATAEKTEEYFIANDLTVINIVREIAQAFEQNNAPMESQVISTKLNIPAEFSDKILNHLVANGIIIKSSEPKIGFIPAQDPTNIKLSHIAEVVAEAGFCQGQEMEAITQSQRSLLSQYTLKQILEDTNITQSD